MGEQRRQGVGEQGLDKGDKENNHTQCPMTPVASSRETMHGSSSWGKPPTALRASYGRR
ncbi:MAG: hypothetical protein V7K40_29125 [Nostoc sp.]